MRYFKKTFIWVIILVAFAGYSYIDFESTRLNEVEKEQATRLLPFDTSEILSVTIKKEGRILELERWEEGWKIIAPIKAKADSETVEKFLGHMTESKNDSEYVMETDPTPERLVEFGLAKPTLYVTLKAGKELASHTIVFGDRAPTMGVAFAQLEGDKSIYRVNADAKAEADKDVYYFRDKSVLRLNPVMLDQFVIKRPEGSIRLKLPENGRWVLEKPIRARADHKRVFNVMTAFANAEVKEFIAETKKDIQTYGLDKPQTELFFWQSGDAKPTVRIQVGNRSPEKRGYFVTMSDRDNIFVLGEDIINAIPRHANDLRSRELFFFDKDRLKRIEIRERKKSIVLVKDKNKDWRRNNVSGELVDFNLVKEFLDEIVDAKIEDFIAGGVKDFGQYGLETAKIKLLLWPEKSAVPLSLNIGKKTPMGKHVYASIGGQNEVLEVNNRIETVLKSYF
ncbi:MAG: DUF4340 domain-containing protein [Nitrospinota bacterium]